MSEREMQALGSIEDGLAGSDPTLASMNGWKFTERVYDVGYLDATPLAGSAPHAAPGRMRES